MEVLEKRWMDNRVDCHWSITEEFIVGINEESRLVCEQPRQFMRIFSLRLASQPLHLRQPLSTHDQDALQSNDNELDDDYVREVVIFPPLSESLLYLPAVFSRKGFHQVKKGLTKNDFKWEIVDQLCIKSFFDFSKLHSTAPISQLNFRQLNFNISRHRIEELHRIEDLFVFTLAQWN
ncbi:hypothetical protein Fmac_014354 [Flemingia macrophylla]|uniref:Uncharacterized protein n=1 Tax=Flemingia macrophylla TaxID=520843 RepID=A0ABD1MBH9_9FABA